MSEEAFDMDFKDRALKSLADDVSRIRERQEVHAEKIDKLERADLLKEHRINDLSDKLSRIEENTTWLKRTITNALIVASLAAAGSIFVWLVTSR